MDDSNNLLYRLINEEIDGTISPEDIKQLKSILVKDKESRSLYGQIRKTMDIIKTSEEIEPPADLKESIMRSIDTGRYARAGKKSIFDSLRTYAVGYRTGFAISFAGGILCGALILAVLTGIFSATDKFETNQLTGTIISDIRSEDTSDVIKNESFNRADVSGSFKALRQGDLVRTKMRISGGSHATYIVNYDPNVFAPIEVTTSPAIISANMMEVNDKGITIRNIDAGDFGITFKKISEGKSSIDFLVKSGTSDNAVYISSLDFE